MIKHLDNRIDKEAMLELTERALELLVPIIGDRMKFISKLKKLKEESKSASDVTCDDLSDVEPAISPLREIASTNKNPSTPLNQSKLRYCMYKALTQLCHVGQD